MRVYRVQDAKGRGPFKPGFSTCWLDPVLAPGRADLPPWGEEFGWDALERLAQPYEKHFGSAVASLDMLDLWFTDSERRRLAYLGYNAACVPHARVLARSEHQLLIASRFPFTECIIIPYQPKERSDGEEDQGREAALQSRTAWR
jgi:hypothetical protein